MMFIRMQNAVKSRVFCTVSWGTVVDLSRVKRGEDFSSVAMPNCLLFTTVL